MLTRANDQLESEQQAQQQLSPTSLHEWAQNVAANADNNVIEKMEFGRLIRNVDAEHIDDKIAAKDDNNETLLHILVRQRRLDLVKFILIYVTRDRLAGILNIQNKQGNTILHLIFAEYKNIYNDKNSYESEQDFKDILKLYPSSERYNALFVIQNNDAKTVFSMLPESLFSDEFAYILGIVDDIQRFYSPSKNKLYILEYDKVSPKNKIQMILDGVYLVNYLKIAVEHFDKYDANNIELLKQIYFFHNKRNSWTLGYSTIYKLANFFNGSQINDFYVYYIDSNEVKKTCPELVHAIQLEVISENLNDNNSPIIKLAEETLKLFNEKYGTSKNQALKQAFHRLALLLLYFFGICVTNRNNLNNDVKQVNEKLEKILQDVYCYIKNQLESVEVFTLKELIDQHDNTQQACEQMAEVIKHYRENKYQAANVIHPISNNQIIDNKSSNSSFEDVIHVINANDYYDKITTQNLLKSVEESFDYILNHSTHPILFCHHQDDNGNTLLHKTVNLYAHSSSEIQAKCIKNLTLLINLVKIANTYENQYDFYDLIVKKNQDGNTVLHLAAQYGYDEIIKILISPLKELFFKEDALNQSDEDGNAILHIFATKHPNKFDQAFALYEPSRRFSAMTLLKNNFGNSVLFEMQPSAHFTNLLTDIFISFTKIHRLLASDIHHHDFMNYIDGLLMLLYKLRECLRSDNKNTQESIKLAFEYYDDCCITNKELFAKLYFMLLPNDQSSLCKKTMSRIKHALEGTIYNESKIENLDPFLITDIEIRILEKKDSSILTSGLLLNRQKLINLLNGKYITNQLNNLMLKIDEFVLSMLKIRNDYHSYNARRNTKKNELLNYLNNVYDYLNNVYDPIKTSNLDNFNQAFDQLKGECKKIADEIDKDHAENSQFSKVGTKSRFAKLIRGVLDKYDDKNETNCTTTTTTSTSSSTIESHLSTDYFNIWAPPLMAISPIPTMYPSLFPSYMTENSVRPEYDEVQTHKIVNAFEMIYPILYTADFSLIKINFISESYKSLSSDLKLSRIDFSFEPMVWQAYKLAKDHYERCDSSNYKLIFDIYEQMDPMLYKNFTVSQNFINTIVKSLNKDKDKKIDKSEIIDQYSDIICHIKMTALKKSKKVLDLGIFNSREQALNVVLDISSETTERTKCFNRLDLFICNLLKIYVVYNPKKNQNRIENKNKLYTSCKDAYEACVAEPALTVEKLTEITDKLYDACQKIAEDVDNDHQDKGPLAKVGKKSKFAKWINKELKILKPNNFTDAKHASDDFKKSKSSRVLHLSTNPFAKHQPRELPAHLQSDDNNEANETTQSQYNDIIKFIKFKDPKTNEILTSLMQKGPSNLFADNSETTSDRRKSARMIKFFDSTKRDILDKTEIIQSIVNHIKHTQVDLAFGEGNLKDALTELKSHLESKIKELRSKSLRHHSETANDLEYFIKENIDPKISSRIDWADDASTYNNNKRYKDRIPQFQL